MIATMFVDELETLVQPGFVLVFYVHDALFEFFNDVTLLVVGFVYLKNFPA